VLLELIKFYFKIYFFWSFSSDDKRHKSISIKDIDRSHFFNYTLGEGWAEGRAEMGNGKRRKAMKEKTYEIKINGNTYETDGETIRLKYQHIGGYLYVEQLSEVLQNGIKQMIGLEKISEVLGSYEEKNGKKVGSAYVGTRGETSYQLVPTKKWAETPIELAEKYMPISGKMMIESSGAEMLITSLLSDTQEVLRGNDHYVELINDLKSVINNIITKSDDESDSMADTICYKLRIIKARDAEIKNLKNLINRYMDYITTKTLMGEGEVIGELGKMAEKEYGKKITVVECDHCGFQQGSNQGDVCISCGSEGTMVEYK